MKAWRIVRPAHAADPLSGEGAARFGTRWNSVGVRIAYASTSRPLAVLEMLVHLTRDYAPRETVLIPIEIPDDLVSESGELPAGWNAFPYGRQSRLFGDGWIRHGGSAAMFVPSAVLPAEKNILVNPAHADFRRIKIGEAEPHGLDRRLFGRA